MSNKEKLNLAKACIAIGSEHLGTSRTEISIELIKKMPFFKKSSKMVEWMID
jgi:hypothetical protein